MEFVIEFTTDLDRFAEQILRILYKEDRFRTLFNAGVVVNTGLCYEGWVESCLGFEQEKEVTAKGNVKFVESVFCIEGIFYFGMNENEYEMRKKNHHQYIQDSIDSDIYIIHGDEYHYTLSHWSDKFEYYSDGTLKYPVIDDLESLIDIYYPHYTIVRKVNANLKKYALLKL